MASTSRSASHCGGASLGNLARISLATTHDWVLTASAVSFSASNRIARRVLFQLSRGGISQFGKFRTGPANTDEARIVGIAVRLLDPLPAFGRMGTTGFNPPLVHIDTLDSQISSLCRHLSFAQTT